MTSGDLFAMPVILTFYLQLRIIECLIPLKITKKSKIAKPLFFFVRAKGHKSKINIFAKRSINSKFN